jgi:uncharacterized protein with PQ loop repeat
MLETPELVPAKTKYKVFSTFIDKIIYVIAVVGNAAVIPQIIKAWSGPAPGLAVLTWLFFVFISLIWLAYAILHQQKPLILAQIIALSCNAAVVGGWLVNNWLR